MKYALLQTKYNRTIMYTVYREHYKSRVNMFIGVIKIFSLRVLLSSPMSLFKVLIISIDK